MRGDAAAWQLAIADLRLRVEAAPGLELSAGPEYAPFLCEDPGAPDLDLWLGEGQGPWFPRGRCLFQGNRALSCFAAGDGPGLVLSVNCGRALRCELRLDGARRQGRIRMAPWLPGRTLQNLPRVLEAAFATSLAFQGGGVLVHAVGLALPELGGVLLPGSSGRGKSTLAQLFPPGETLSDERVALTRGAAGPRIHGTPWRGSAGRVQAASAPLAAIALLGPHAPPWGLRPLGAAEAFRRLAFHGFPPLWDRAGLARTLDLAREVAQAVPSYELRFRPADGAAGLRRVLSEAPCLS